MYKKPSPMIWEKPTGHWDRKKRPGINFFAKAILAGLTN